LKNLSEKKEIKQTFYCEYVRYSDIGGIDFNTETREKIFPEYWSNKLQAFKQRIAFYDVSTEKHKTEIEDRFTEI
jgi:hypothetical protein